MSKEIIDALKQLETEKNLDPKDIVDALEQALASAYRKNYHIDDEETEVRVEFNNETGDITVLKKEPDEDKEKDVTPKNFGRIAAQTAKQVILQRIREAERSVMFEEYRGREGDIVTGIVQQSDARYTLISLGKVEALLPPNEQVHTERYRHGTRIKAYITEVRKTTKDPQIVVSRSHPGLLRKLFELEVPEITEGFCEIKAVAREPGSRSKIAVHSSDANVDPVGSCVGPRGSRVRMVVGELWGEKIDVVHYDDDMGTYIANALSPAKVKGVNINEEHRAAEVIVPDDQLSLAIGKEGQNARLAAKLTGWRIDIKSDTQMKKEELGEEFDDGEKQDAEKTEAAIEEKEETTEETKDAKDAKAAVKEETVEEKEAEDKAEDKEAAGKADDFKEVKEEATEQEDKKEDVEAEKETKEEKVELAAKDEEQVEKEDKKKTDEKTEEVSEDKKQQEASGEADQKADEVAEDKEAEVKVDIKAEDAKEKADENKEEAEKDNEKEKKEQTEDQSD